MTRWLSTPTEAAKYYLQWARALENAPGIDYGCILDRYMIPLHPGDLMAVVARPGHGKSSYLAYMAMHAARDIVANKRTDEVVIYATWEQSVEEVESFFESGDKYTSTELAWGRVPIERIEHGVVDRPLLPIWLMGNSLHNIDPHKAPMTVDEVFHEIRNLKDDFGKRPALICLDYLQIIPIDKQKERNQQVHEATIQAKQLAMAVGCPIIAGVQASRAVDKNRDGIPTMGDAQWSSAIEQTADKQLALYRPIKNYEKNINDKEPEFIVYNDKKYYHPQELLIIRLLKQRFDVGYGTWAVRFKPQTLEMFDYMQE
jgi:replicative DNA helicase